MMAKEKKSTTSKPHGFPDFDELSDDDYSPEQRNNHKSNYNLQKYGIKPLWSISKIIEHLLLYYNLPEIEISKLLNISIEDVAANIKDIEIKWKDLGKTLTSEQKEEEKGKLISKLTKLERNIDLELSKNPGDGKLLDLQLKVLEKLTKLRAIDENISKDITEIEDFNSKLLEKLNALDIEELSAMEKELNS